MASETTSEATGAGEGEAADPIFAEIKATLGRIRKLEHALADLKVETKAVNGDLEATWKRLAQLNEDLVNPLPLFDGPPPATAGGDAAPEPCVGPEPAAPEGHTNWRTVPVSELEKHGLAAKVAATLREGGVGTIGDVSDLGKNGLSLTDVKGVGEKAAEKIEAALDAFWKAWGPEDERPARHASGLTDDQARELADVLEGSTANVFEVGREAVGVVPTQDVFDHLRAVAGLIRCPDCSEWKRREDFPAIDEADPDAADPMCFECLNHADEGDEG